MEVRVSLFFTVAVAVATLVPPCSATVLRLNTMEHHAVSETQDFLSYRNEEEKISFSVSCIQLQTLQFAPNELKLYYGVLCL